MRASRQGTKLDQCGPVANEYPPPVRCRFKAMRIRNHLPPGPCARNLGERRFDDPPLLADLARDHGKIIFLDHPRLEHLLERGARLRRACEQQAAAGVGVEPMHCRRRALEAAFQFADTISDAVPATARRVDRQSRGLIEHHRLGVDEQDAVGEHGFP